MHGAIGAFFCEIPATSRFSVSFESNLLEIRVHYHVAPTENTLEKPKKKVPPSKVRRNRRRLLKFLEKPEAQPDLPLASHKRSGEGEGIFAPPSTTHPEPCAKKASHYDVSVEFDSANGVDSGLAPPLSLHTEQATSCTENHMGEGEKDEEQGKEMESVNNENSSKNEGMISKDKEPGWITTGDLKKASAIIVFHQ